MAEPSNSHDTVVIVASHQDADDMERLCDRLPAPVRARTIHEWVDIAAWLPSPEQWASHVEGLKATLATLGIDPGKDWDEEHKKAPHRFTQQWAGLILQRLKHTLARACAVVLPVGRGLLAASASWRAELALLLGTAAEQGTVILPVVMEAVTDAESLLGRFALLHDPGRPLRALAPEDREEVWAQVAAAVEFAFERSRDNTQPEAEQMRGPWEQGAFLRTLSGQLGRVIGLAWSPDGRHIAAACDDTRVYLWEVETGERTLTYEGHAGEINAIAWAPDGARLATVGSEASDNAQVWEAATGRRLVTYTGHAGHEALAVAWSPDGREIATGSSDHTVQVWDATTGQHRLTYTGHTDQVNTLAWSPDGVRIVSGAGDAWNGNVRDPTAQVWQAQTGARLLTFPGYLDPVRVVAWSPDGKRIASVNPGAQVWDATTGQRLLVHQGHTRTVRALAWSPDGMRIVSSGDDGTAQVWDAETGAELFTYHGHTGPFAGASGGVFAVVWSPDGARIASGDHRAVDIWTPSGRTH